MKRKIREIVYENHKNMVAPNDQYRVDEHGAVRRICGKRRLTKGQREALRRNK